MDYHSKRFNIPVHNKRLTTQRLSKYMDLLILLKQLDRWLESHWNRGFTIKLRILAAIITQLSFQDTFAGLTW